MDNIKKDFTVQVMSSDFVTIFVNDCIIIDGRKETLRGRNTATTIANSSYGRSMLQRNYPENLANSVLTFWGDVATVVDPEEITVPDAVDDPTEDPLDFNYQINEQ